MSGDVSARALVPEDMAALLQGIGPGIYRIGTQETSGSHF